MEIQVSKDNIAQGVEKMQNAISHLEEELKTFRAGKADTGFVEKFIKGGA